MDSMKLVPYIEDSKLSDYAASCAKAMQHLSAGSGKAEAAQLRRCRQSIDKCHSTLRRRYEGAARVPAECEWLLDNHYMIQREYPGTLRELEQAQRQRSFRGRLLVSELCRALLQAGHGSISARRCEIFLAGFQSVNVLQRRELLLFPAALRGVLIEALAQCAEKLKGASESGQLADDFAALFTSLRLLATMDMERILDSAEICGKILARDPSGEYEGMDRQTRGEYLERLSTLAYRQSIEEQLMAEKLIAKAQKEQRHIGFYLFSPPSPVRAALYTGSLCLLTLFLSFFIAYSFNSILSAVLLLLPIWSMVKGFMDFILLRFIRPRPMPRMDTEHGIPPEGKSICVISALLGCCDAARLEELYLASHSNGKNLSFGFLADLNAASEETRPEDEKLINEAREAIEGLNEKYGGGFYFFCRPRSFDGEGWSGYERKRGALLELAKLLCGEESALSVYGDRKALGGTRYIISLDADTRIYPGSLTKLIGAALHPLCRPVIDEKQAVVKRGHAIIHPRIETELESASATDFAIIFSGGGGSDPYGGLCTELYMDAFGNGGFAGKGLIDAEALLKCTLHRFPAGRILSHDALEGAYLKGAYMSDAEFSDEFPASALSYYKRQHRWIRGDWQNAPWLFAAELSSMDRFRLFDSLRRSLSPPMTLIAMLFGFCMNGPGLRLAAWAALFSMLQTLFISLAESGFSRHHSTRLRRHTRLLNGVGGAIVRCFMQLWLLPFEAWVCLSAALTALWRMLFSHKKLLQWQTFAQSSGGSDFGGHIKSMWIAVALGVVLMAFSPSIIGKVSGLMWLLSPAAAAALALPAFREQELSGRDRELLTTAVRDHWLYLKELSRKEDNFLPPDNFQQQPPVGTAHRTSPTNIGLALAAAAAAAYAGISKQSDAVNYISKMLSTLERMSVHRGHFYNWYDTRSLRPLTPAHISAVDSGNMYAGLLVTAAVLEEWGRFELSDRIRKLMAAMDFSMLYDRQRELFYISYDPKNERGVGGWYDLMASEAMLTSYLALAKGDVPLKHWRRLSRAQLQKDGYRGLASWTGTMFEYLMPALFLPVYRASLLYESDRFCLYAQKRRHYPGKPWGISESAFYSLDAGLNYRYKAHGCPALALKRGQEADMVISPYSSFLALAIDPQAAAKNLRKLKDMGAYGRWGFIEALDFTPDRCSREDGEAVRCWMAHHVSMSILAAINALDGGSVRTLFLSSPDMAAHTLLLQEKLPGDSALIRRDSSPVPERPAQKLRRSWQLRGSDDDKEFAVVLSNGAYSLRIKNNGESAAFLGDICVYDMPAKESMSLKLNGKALLPEGETELWELGDERCRWRISDGDSICSIVRAAAEAELGEYMDVELKSPGRRPAKLELSFVPVLAKLSDRLSHRAYWKLGISAKAQGNELILRRLAKSDNRELWLCLCCSENAGFSADEDGGTGALAEPFVKATVTLKPNDKNKVRFALCLGSTESEATEGARRILFSAGSAAGSMAGAAAARLGMSRDEFGAAMELVLPLWQNRMHHAAAQRELWPYGISGDLPIICCDGRANELEWLLKAFCLLKSCGMEAELVLFSEEQGEYMQPLAGRIEKTLSFFGLEALIGSPGGVFIVSAEGREIIGSRAAVFIGEDRHLPPPPPDPSAGSRALGSCPDYNFGERAFEFDVKKSLPPRAWQHILTNGTLSAFAADFGPAGLWLENAREMKLIAPPGDIKACTGHERVYVLYEGKEISLFAADDGFDCRVSFSPGHARWCKRIGKREIETCLFIHPELNARILSIKGAEGLEVYWQAQPHMGSKDSASLRLKFDDGFPVFTNPESYLPGTKLLFAASDDFSAAGGFCPEAVQIKTRATRHTLLVCACFDKAKPTELLDIDKAEAAMKAAAEYWEDISSRVRLKLPASAMEHYMNTWAVYQALACRLMARASIYQSGGAFGFRDQLQDSINLMLIDPGLAREQILRCCRHQYKEGDVMHWWHAHPNGDKGIRSRCSDDLLWLVWALCEYCQACGDTDLCRREEPFLISPTLKDGERDRYEVPGISEDKATVLQHAKAALDCCIERGFGSHGLPLMGSGDWNDGLDRVEGESVWLGWFFSHCANRFALLMQELGEDGFERYSTLAQKVGHAADACHNGSWYQRAFFPDGSPLGDGERIDSIAQSWAAFCPWSSKDKVLPALCHAMDILRDKNHNITKLLSPPYSADERSPGYISGYGKGYRENGGQYSHAAIWLAMAALSSGMNDEAWEIMNALLPENHRAALYQAEPFVLPADVCSAPGREGLAGWTWYTGSAGWFFRVAACEIFGLRLMHGRLYIRPALPSRLPGFELEWRSPSGKSFHIICREDSISVNGRPYNGEGLEI